MARVTYGALITELAGSIGGITFQRNSSGSIARLKPNLPVNPSPEQALQNNSLATLVSLWSSLSAADKLSWNTFAGLHLKTDDWGNAKQLNGFQWFMACNLNLLFVGEAIINTAPAWTALAPPTTFTLSADETFFKVTFSAPYVPATNYTMVYVSAPLRQSSLKQRRSLFSAGPQPVTGTLYIALKTAYESLFNLTWADFFNSADASIIVHVKQIQEGTGLSSPFTSSLIKI